MAFITQRDDSLADFKLYHYDPSMAAAVVFILLFLTATALHGFQMFKTRTWFMIPFFIGGIFEFIGYCGRAASAQQTPDWTIGPYVIQSILLLVAPALFAASIYMELGRISLMVKGDHLLIIRRTWLTKIFVAGDVLSFLMQSGGGGLLAGGGSSVDAGEKLILGGLALQILFFALFVVAGVLFHIGVARQSTQQSKQLPYQKHLYSLYFVSILIFVRSFVRLVEYAQGWTGYIISHEIYLYIFDATLMLLAMLAMNIVHSSEVAALIRGSGRMVEKVIRTKDVQATQYQLGPWA